MEWLVLIIIIAWWASGTLPLIFGVWGDEITWGDLLLSIILGAFGGSLILVAFGLMYFSELPWLRRPIRRRK